MKLLKDLSDNASVCTVRFLPVAYFPHAGGFLG